jgi:GTP cyclohydrolase I
MNHITELSMTKMATLMFEGLPGWQNVPEEHKEKTPARYVKALEEMTTPDLFEFTTFSNTGNDEMITLGPISFYTLCAHHVVPFFGQCWIGYVPEGRIAGLSKFARQVESIAKGFWVQEELTTSLAEILKENLQTENVAVVMKAEHLCMAMRGIRAAGVITTTSSMGGVFADHNRTAKAEFMQGVK